MNWDNDYLWLAERWADKRSKDPRTKVGAIIVDEMRRVVSMGYNGFPRGVDDARGRYNDRFTKLAMVVHAEANAIISARGGVPLGSTIYSSLFPCNECVKLILQTPGIVRVVTRPVEPKRVDVFHEHSITMLREARMLVVQIP